MGYLAEMSDGTYILYVEIGSVTVAKVFEPVEMSFDEVPIPMPDGFYLYIPDVKSFEENSDK